jgi:PAS domain S-box-containing protein
VSPLSGLHAQRLFALSVDLLIVMDGDGRIVHVNPSWERVLGYRAEDLIGRRVLELPHPDDVTRTAEALAAMKAGTPVPNFENRLRHADGHDVWMRWSGIVDEHEGLIYSSARDITKERRAMDDAQAAIRRMEDAQRVAHVGSWEWNLRTGERHYTREMFAIQGQDPADDDPWGMEELLARVDPAHHQRIRDASARMYGSPGTRVEVEYRQLVPEERWIRTVMEAVPDEHREPYLLRGTTQDVSELRVNERRLAEAERLADIGSFEWRVSDGAVVWSEGTYRLFGRDPSLPPLTQRDMIPLALPDEVTRWEEVVAIAASGEAWELEFSFPMPGGRGRRVVACRGEAYRTADDTFVRGTMQDITAQRRVAQQQQAIARLGQLALAGTDLKELFDEVCRVAIELLGTDTAGILALQGDGSLAYAATVGYAGEPRGTAIAAHGDSVVRDVLTSDTPLIVPDWHAAEDLPYPPQLRERGVRCSAILPIRGRDGPFGVLTTHAVEPGVTDPAQNLAFLDALSSFLATAIERLRHEAEIAALATLRGRLVAENLEAEERVRRRISEQLHDGALQDLLAARQDLVEAAGPSADADTREEMLGYAREGVERAVKLLREAVHALHPVVLQHGGLEAAMQAAADQAARQGSFRAEVTVDTAAAGLRDELVLSLARELLNNAAKHAEADVVQVTVARQDGNVLLEVTDDGRGLDPAAIAAAPMNGHIGLASLTQRVEAVGGTLDLRGAATGRGTTVLARLPIG